MNMEVRRILTVAAAQVERTFHLAARRVLSALSLRIAIRKAPRRAFRLAVVFGVTAITVAIATRAVDARPIRTAGLVFTAEE
jgi:hypothetical protein